MLMDMLFVGRMHQLIATRLISQASAISTASPFVFDETKSNT